MANYVCKYEKLQNFRIEIKLNIMCQMAEIVTYLMRNIYSNSPYALSFPLNLLGAVE